MAMINLQPHIRTMYAHVAGLKKDIVAMLDGLGATSALSSLYRTCEPNLRPALEKHYLSIYAEEYDDITQPPSMGQNEDLDYDVNVQIADFGVAKAWVHLYIHNDSAPTENPQLSELDDETIIHAVLVMDTWAEPDPIWRCMTDYPVLVEIITVIPDDGNTMTKIYMNDDDHLMGAFIQGDDEQRRAEIEQRAKIAALFKCPFGEAGFDHAVELL